MTTEHVRPPGENAEDALARPHPWPLLSRRDLLRSVPGLAAVALLPAWAEAARAEARPLPLGTPALRPRATPPVPAGPLALPFWGDGAAWDQPQYYETIQAGRRLQVNRTVQNADIDGDGDDELIARGPGGVLVHKFDPVTGQWLNLPSMPAWSDAAGWNIPKRYLNIMTADIDGDGRAELIGRNPASIEVHKYDTDPKSPTYKTWIRLPDGPPWQDGWAWDRPPYYPTIQCADIDGDGQDEILGRSTDASPQGLGDPNGGGIQCWKYDPAGKKWNQLAEGPAWTDANGWNVPYRYATIQCAPLLLPGDPRYTGDGTHAQAALLGRSASGVEVWTYARGRWGQLETLPGMTDGLGWVSPQYYLTIQCADLDGDGRAEVLGRDGTGIQAWKYAPATNAWTQLPPGPRWNDNPAGWNQPQYYATIQCADLNGDGRAELFARAGAGILVYNYDPKTRAWNELPAGPAWSDGAGWNQVQYYGTIQTARVGLPPLTPGTTPGVVLLGRDSLGIKTWRFDPAAAPNAAWQRTSAPYPPFTGRRLVCYDYITTALNIQLPDPNAPGAGIRYRYNDQTADFSGWKQDLSGANPVGPPPGFPANDPDWLAVKDQIVHELTWVMDVNNWFVGNVQQQVIATFQAKDLTLYTVGPYLDYAQTDPTSLSVPSILALIFGGLAAILGFPELEAGAAAAVAGTIGAGCSAAAAADPGGDWLHGFQANYDQLQTQLANAFTAAYVQSGLIPQGITGGLGGPNGAIYQPGDYGLLSAIGQQIESTVWNWPTGNTVLVAASQRAYATSAFQFLFANYQAQADPSKVYTRAWYGNQPNGYPGDFPYSYLYIASYFGPIYWLQLGYPWPFPPTPTMQALFGRPQPGATDAFPLGVPIPDFYLGQNGWQPLTLVNMGPPEAVRLPQLPPPSLGADVQVTAGLTRDAVTGRLSAAVTLTNRGMTAANNVELTGVFLGSLAALTAPHTRQTRLAPGRQVTHDIEFPPLPAGQRAVLRVTGRDLDGTFGGSFRVTAP